MRNFTGLKVHIIGMGSLGTGQACAHALTDRGAQVEISDQKTEEELSAQIAGLADLPIVFHLGDKAYTDIEQAQLVIPSPGVPLDIPALQKARAAGIPVVSEIEVAYWIAPCPIIAVTGTKGKTTTTTLIGHLIEDANRPVLVGGNIGTPLIQLAAHAGPEHLLVAEVSSFQLEATRDFRPSVALFLSFFADHLDRHPDLDSYWQAKTKIFANQTEDDYAILNFDLPELRKLAGSLKSKVLSFALKHKADARLRRKSLEIFDQTVLQKSDINLRGDHNLSNVLAALCAVHAAGVPLDNAAKTLAEFKGVPNRLEEVGVVNDITFINDSQATVPEAVEVALLAMEAPTVLIAGGRPKVSDFSALGKAVADKTKAVVLIGEAADAIADALVAAGGAKSKIHRAGTMPEAVQAAFALAEPGEIVLMSPACASFDMFTNMAHRGEIFRQAVRSLQQEEATP